MKFRFVDWFFETDKKKFNIVYKLSAFAKLYNVHNKKKEILLQTLSQYT